jgi:DtxR family Mn-dependent transcriptional regulator
MSIPEQARRTQPNADSASEDYLKTIYQHTEWQNDPVTPSVLASTLGVAPSSVTEMAKKLSLAGLVNYEPYKPLTLTAAGVSRARGVLRRHRLIETWLVKEMGYDWHEVHDEAEVLEHSISERLLDAIDSRLGHPAQDPHGDPIPSADGTVREFPAVLLAEAAAGDTGAIVRISDRDPALLEALAAAGVGPGTVLTVGPSDASGRVVLQLARAQGEPAAEVTVPADGTASIWIQASA